MNVSKNERQRLTRLIDKYRQQISDLKCTIANCQNQLYALDTSKYIRELKMIFGETDEYSDFVDGFKEITRFTSDKSRGDLCPVYKIDVYGSNHKKIWGFEVHDDIRAHDLRFYPTRAQNPAHQSALAYMCTHMFVDGEVEFALGDLYGCGNI